MVGGWFYEVLQPAGTQVLRTVLINRLTERGNRMCDCTRHENDFVSRPRWRESMALVEHIYALSSRFPSEERFGLTSQLRRAAVSIPSNIGEGARRKRRKAFLHYLDIALGSQGEVDVQLELAARLSFCSAADRRAIQERVDRVGRMLNGLITSLQPQPWHEEDEQSS